MLDHDVVQRIRHLARRLLRHEVRRADPALLVPQYLRDVVVAVQEDALAQLVFESLIYLDDERLLELRALQIRVLLALQNVLLLLGPDVADVVRIVLVALVVPETDGTIDLALVARQKRLVAQFQIAQQLRISLFNSDELGGDEGLVSTVVLDEDDGEIRAEPRIGALRRLGRPVDEKNVLGRVFEQPRVPRLDAADVVVAEPAQGLGRRVVGELDAAAGALQLGLQVVDGPGQDRRLPALLDERQEEVDDEGLALPLVLLALERLVAEPRPGRVFFERLPGLQGQLWLVLGPELEVVLGLVR